MELLQKVAGTPMGTRAVKTGSASFLEKAINGENKDENDKQILSTTLNKEIILKSLQNGLEKAVDPELKKSYENSIMRYNAGGGSIDKAVAIDQYENFNVRLTQ
jgi:hypothetical protein